MIIFETIGLFIIAFGCIVALTLFCSFFVCGPNKIDEQSITISLFGIVFVLLLFASAFFVQFKHYPEKFGYTVIEEVEESEE